MEALLPSIATHAANFEKIEDFEHFRISPSSQSLFSELWLHIISLCAGLVESEHSINEAASEVSSLRNYEMAERAHHHEIRVLIGYLTKVAIASPEVLTVHSIEKASSSSAGVAGNNNDKEAHVLQALAQPLVESLRMRLLKDKGINAHDLEQADVKMNKI